MQTENNAQLNQLVSTLTKKLSDMEESKKDQNTTRQRNEDDADTPSNKNLEKPATENEEKLAKPWFPLMITMLALFGSAGGNAFLAWMAWDYVERYRSLSDELRQMRTSDAD